MELSISRTSSRSATARMASRCSSTKVSVRARFWTQRLSPDRRCCLGFTGVDEKYGTVFASLGLAEKGSVNLQLKVDSLGGHSSVPPVHTSIGILSALLTEMEAHPFKPELQAESPYLQSLQCYSGQVGPLRTARASR